MTYRLYSIIYIGIYVYIYVHRCLCGLLRPHNKGFCFEPVAFGTDLETSILKCGVHMYIHISIYIYILLLYKDIYILYMYREREL